MVSFALARLQEQWNDGKHLPIIDVHFYESLLNLMDLNLEVVLEGEIKIKIVIDRIRMDRHVWDNEYTLANYLYQRLTIAMEIPRE